MGTPVTAVSGILQVCSTRSSDQNRHNRTRFPNMIRSSETTWNNALLSDETTIPGVTFGRSMNTARDPKDSIAAVKHGGRSPWNRGSDQGGGDHEELQISENVTQNPKASPKQDSGTAQIQVRSNVRGGLSAGEKTCRSAVDGTGGELRSSLPKGG